MNRVPVTDAAREAKVSRATVFNYLRLGLLVRYRRPGLDKRTFVDLDALLRLRASKEAGGADCVPVGSADALET